MDPAVYPKSVEDQGSIITRLRSREEYIATLEPRRSIRRERRPSGLEKCISVDPPSTVDNEKPGIDQCKDVEAAEEPYVHRTETNTASERLQRLSLRSSHQGPSDDPNLVTWDGPDDPLNPMNWPTLRRWSHICVVSAFTFLVGLSSSMFAPGVPKLMEQFGSDNSALSSFVVTVFILGLAFGPVLFAPLSELQGRKLVQGVGCVGFTGFTVGCALAPNLSGLIVLRLLQGIFGSVSLTNGGAIISDVVKQEERGLALSIYAYGYLFGPIIGPVAGAFLTDAKGWRWVFWIISICLGFVSCLSFLIFRESYEPYLLRQKAARLRAETGNPDLRCEYDSDLPPRQHFLRGIGRTIYMLIYSPVILSLSIYTGLIYSYFYLLFTTFTSIFGGIYHFPSKLVGLSFLGLGIGFLIGQFGFSKVSDRLLTWLAERKGTALLPEYRMPPCLIGAVLIPVGFFWYGWAAESGVHWIVPLIGTSFVGAGNSMIFMSINTYTIDAFDLYSASALAANTVTRSIMAAVLPLAAPKMYAAMGVGWGNSLLAFLAIAMIPLPWLLYKYGERLRRLNEEKFTYI